jgi:hypothetical protein
MAWTAAAGGHLRNGSMARAGVVEGHLGNGVGGAHLGGREGGGWMKHTWADRGGQSAPRVATGMAWSS